MLNSFLCVCKCAITAINRVHYYNHHSKAIKYLRVNSAYFPMDTCLIHGDRPRPLSRVICVLTVFGHTVKCCFAYVYVREFTTF